MNRHAPNYCQVMRITGNDGTVKELLFPKALDLNRPKRPRTTFSNEQLQVLECEFTKNPYLVGKEREKLAKDLQLSETQVKVWFQNRRTKKKFHQTSPIINKNKIESTNQITNSSFQNSNAYSSLFYFATNTQNVQQQIQGTTMSNSQQNKNDKDNSFLKETSPLLVQWLLENNINNNYLLSNTLNYI